MFVQVQHLDTMSSTIIGECKEKPSTEETCAMLSEHFGGDWELEEGNNHVFVSEYEEEVIVEIITPRPNRVREIKEEQILSFLEDLKKPREALLRISSIYDDFKRTEWLGGNIELCAQKVPPKELGEVMEKLGVALKLLSEADHEAMMYLVGSWNKKLLTNPK